MARNLFPEQSCFNQLQVKYKGRERENTDNETTTTIVYQGSREICEAAFEEINTNERDPAFGNIESVRLYQDDGPIWNIEIKYAIEKHGVGLSSSKGSSYGPKSSTLTIRTITRPIESLKKYRMHWNNNLYCTMTGQAKPSWWADATLADDKITGNENREWPAKPGIDPSTHAYWCWAKSISECQALPEPYTWHLNTKMTKPGVEYKDCPTYELTESSKHGSKKQAAWAVLKKAGYIAKPEEGDFDITKKYYGNWLCEGATVSYDRKILDS